VQEQIYLLSENATVVRPKEDLPTKPSSFGVYLGSLSTPVSEEETHILSRWGAVVLNYSEPGVLDALNDERLPLGPHIIARLDLCSIVNFVPMDDEVNMFRVVYLVSKTIRQYLRLPDQRRYFTGVLIAGWRERVSIPLLNGIAKLCSSHGLDVFLEIGPPDYLDQIHQLNLQRFAGAVVRNGTILQNGERRDFFAMDKMKSTTKAFVSQSCLRPFTTLIWDTIDDDAELSHAVTRRAHMWCSYHGAIPYIVRQTALTNMSQVRYCEEPLAAFQWLKNRKVMSIHEKFRITRVVSLQPKS
jgi:hypothetical protein